MNIKVFGIKLRVECIIISMVIGFLLCSHLFCGCATKEGYQTAGAALNYVMNKGVHNNTYDKKYCANHTLRIKLNKS